VWCGIIAHSHASHRWVRRRREDEGGGRRRREEEGGGRREDSVVDALVSMKEVIVVIKP